jgi:2,3-dihydroxybenzoate decarboxylase
MVRKIALEEHFIDPATFDYWRPTMSEVPAPFVEKLIASLTDFGERRLKMMDECGLAHCVLAASGRARHRDRDPQGARVQRLSRQGSDEAAGPLFRFRASADAGREGGRRRT